MKIVANFVHRGAIIEAEPSEMGHDADVCQTSDETVVGSTNAVHEPALVACVLDSGNNGCALLPGAEHVGEKLGRVLEVSDEDSYDVALGLKEGVHAGAVGSDIAGVDDDLNAGVLGSHLAEYADGVVGGGVVDEEVLEVVLGRGGGDGHQAPVDLANVQLLVIAGSHDRDQLPGHFGTIRHTNGIEFR